MKTVIKVVVGFALFFILSAFVVMILDKNGMLPKSKANNAVVGKEKAPEDHHIMAYIASENYIKGKLIHATSFDFPFLPAGAKSDFVKQNYLVHSSVEFEIDGVKYKRLYHSILHFKGGEESNDNNWEITAFDFE